MLSCPAVGALNVGLGGPDLWERPPFPRPPGPWPALVVGTLVGSDMADTVGRPNR